MSALIKKRNNNERLVYESPIYRDEDSKIDKSDLRVIDRLQHGCHEVRVLVTQIREGERFRAWHTITEVQDLDDLILSLQALRETYE